MNQWEDKAEVEHAWNLIYLSARMGKMSVLDVDAMKVLARELELAAKVKTAVEG